MKILLVDDDQLTLKSIDHVLKKQGYEVVLAEDASTALNILNNEKIDLIISDIMMPNVSGLGLLSMLKNFYIDRIPVILISSLDRSDIITNSQELGAAYFLAKPIDLVKLLEYVKNAIG